MVATGRILLKQVASIIGSKDDTDSTTKEGGKQSSGGSRNTKNRGRIGKDNQNIECKEAVPKEY